MTGPDTTAGEGRAAVRPDTQFFALRRTWLDPEPGIEMVELRYTWGPLGAEPDWERGDCRVLTPHEQASALRTAVIEVPRYSDGSPTYGLHHFFFVVRGTDRITSPVITEEIVAREVTYTDDAGRWTHVGLAWGVAPEGIPELAAPNYTAATMDGLPFSDPGGGAPVEPAPVYEFVRAQPLPHVFRGLVWGPRGFELRYAFHLVRAGSPRPEEDDEVWEDNVGSGWVLTL